MSEIERAAEIILSARKGVAFTGAGISAASGISTYRDEGGLWDRYGSQGMLNVLAKHPDKAHEILGGFFSALEAARPNPAHLALAQLKIADLTAHREDEQRQQIARLREYRQALITAAVTGQIDIPGDAA